MKKLIVVLFILAVISPVFAQQNDEKKESFYYINVPVEKIFPSSEGYIVMYRSSNTIISTIGIPNDWFYDSAGAAQMVKLPLASDWPTMTVFYREGKFSHVRLYTHPVKGHSTWGNIPQGTNVSRFFSSDKDSFKLEF
ncbi:MAG: hypothetical protein FWF68_01530 [Spirochaetes bacterium]|nr:hypothetical protein [Spirochaetota bacterium]